MLAAALSLLYLGCFMTPYVPGAPEASKGPMRYVVYHVAWAWLRPAYTVLFTAYLLKAKAWPGTVHPVYLAMCWFGLQYYAFFCPLADTKMTHMHNRFCDGGGELQHYPGHYMHNSLGVAYHGVEAHVIYNLFLIKPSLP